MNLARLDEVEKSLIHLLSSRISICYTWFMKPSFWHDGRNDWSSCFDHPSQRHRHTASSFRRRQKKLLVETFCCGAPCLIFWYWRPSKDWESCPERECPRSSWLLHVATKRRRVKCHATSLPPMDSINLSKSLSIIQLNYKFGKRSTYSIAILWCRPCSHQIFLSVDIATRSRSSFIARVAAMANLQVRRRVPNLFRSLLLQGRNIYSMLPMVWWSCWWDDEAAVGSASLHALLPTPRGNATNVDIFYLLFQANSSDSIGLRASWVVSSSNEKEFFFPWLLIGC